MRTKSRSCLLTTPDETDPSGATGEPSAPSEVDAVEVEYATVVEKRDERVVDLLATINPLRVSVARIGRLCELPEGSQIGRNANLASRGIAKHPTASR